MKQMYPNPTLAERYPLAFAAAALDFLLVMAACFTAYTLRFGFYFLRDDYLVASVVIGLVVVVCQIVVGSYLSWRGVHFLRQLGRLFSGWLLALAVSSGMAVLLQVAENYSRLWFLSTLAVALLFLALFRFGIYLLLRFTRARGRNQKKVLLVQAGASAAGLRQNIAQNPEYGFEIAAILPYGTGEQWLAKLHDEVLRLGVHELWLCLPLEEGRSFGAILHALRHSTIDVRYFPDLGDLPLLNYRVGEIAGHYTLDLSSSPMQGPARLLKRAEDLILGFLISLLILPVCLCVALAIKFSSPGPVIFKQYRTGLNGRKFKVYKFRSMEVHEEATGELTQAQHGDPRVTRLGRFLRRTSLDELPQFFNVLQGRMSIVGPRPHALAHNDYYKDLVESYMQRHKVKPGITGWAQVNGLRGETDTLDKMARRVEYDLWYIDHWSLGLDLRIIALTVFRGFFNSQP